MFEASQEEGGMKGLLVGAMVVVISGGYFYATYSSHPAQDAVDLAVAARVAADAAKLP